MSDANKAFVRREIEEIVNKPETKTSRYRWLKVAAPTLLMAGLTASGFTVPAAAADSPTDNANKARSHHARILGARGAMGQPRSGSPSLMAAPLENAIASSDGSGSSPRVGWVDEFGTAGDDVVWAVAVDGEDVYVYGDTNGALPGQTSAGGFDVFLRKYDSRGNLIWTRQFGSSEDEFAFGAVNMAAKDGEIYVAGLTFGTLPGQTSAGGLDAFLRKYDADGVEQWTHQFGTATFDDIHGVAIADRRVYVAGSTQAALPGQTYAGGFEDGFLRKYDNDGNELWTRQFGTAGDDHPIVAAADDGAVYVGGITDGTFPGQTSAGGVDAFIRKYSENGRLRWTRQFGTPGFDETWGIAADDGAVYIHGDTQGALPGQVSSGGFDAFLRKYSAGGRERWTRQYGTPADDFAAMLAVEDRTINLAGITLGAFPGQANSGINDAYVRTYNRRGNVGWTFQFGTASFDGAFGIASDDEEAVFVGGFTGGPLFGQSFSGGAVDGYVLLLLVDRNDDEEDDD